MADKRFVITVAPQKDIWPQGRTYPMKAEAIKIKSIKTPTFQVPLNFQDLKKVPRNKWKYKKIKKKKLHYCVLDDSFILHLRLG